jgi:hypothetical protein
MGWMWEIKEKESRVWPEQLEAWHCHLLSWGRLKEELKAG